MKTKINNMNVTHIDTDTGEIIGSTSGVTTIQDNNLTKSEQIRNEYIKEHILNFNKNRNYVKLWTEVSYLLAMTLKPKELQVAIALSKYISYEDCALVIGYGKGQHYMDLKEIASELHSDYTNISRVINSLITKGVLGKFITGNKFDNTLETIYVANPFIFLKGKNPSSDVCNYFLNSGWIEKINEMEEQIV